MAARVPAYTGEGTLSCVTEDRRGEKGQKPLLCLSLCSVVLQITHPLRVQWVKLLKTESLPYLLVYSKNTPILLTAKANTGSQRLSSLAENGTQCPGWLTLPQMR